MCNVVFFCLPERWPSNGSWEMRGEREWPVGCRLIMYLPTRNVNRVGRGRGMLGNGGEKMSYTMSGPRQQSRHDHLDIVNNPDTIISDKWPSASDPWSCHSQQTLLSNWCEHDEHYDNWIYVSTIWQSWCHRDVILSHHLCRSPDTVMRGRSRKLN